MDKHYDIVIVGGGLVGACLAIALKNSRYKIAVLESKKPHVQMPKAPIDDRAIVISKASQNILSALHLWGRLSENATSITDIHVSNKNRFGAVRLSAHELQEDAFGYVIQANYLYAGLQQALDLCANVDVFFGSKFEAIKNSTVIFNQDGHKELTADLVVAADGSHSIVRSQQNIETQMHDYDQSVIICNVRLKKDHDNVAYERFTKSGPLAILPMAEKTCAVVWASTPRETEKLMALPIQDFQNKLQKHFGYRVGKILEVSQPFSFPLSFLRAKEQVRPGLALIGNAAQTLHPIAGQGLNLGLRDMASLSEILLETKKSPGNINVLEAYAAWREFDRRHIMSLTHGLVTLFSNDFLPLAYGRSAGLFVMDKMPLTRRVFAQSTMGLVGRLPKLACGIEYV